MKLNLTGKGDFHMTRATPDLNSPIRAFTISIWSDLVLDTRPVLCLSFKGREGHEDLQQEDREKERGKLNGINIAL